MNLEKFIIDNINKVKDYVLNNKYRSFIKEYISNIDKEYRTDEISIYELERFFVLYNILHHRKILISEIVSISNHVYHIPITEYGEFNGNLHIKEYTLFDNKMNDYKRKYIVNLNIFSFYGSLKYFKDILNMNKMKKAIATAYYNLTDNFKKLYVDVYISYLNLKDYEVKISYMTNNIYMGKSIIEIYNDNNDDDKDINNVNKMEFFNILCDEVDSNEYSDEIKNNIRDILKNSVSENRFVPVIHLNSFYTLFLEIYNGLCKHSDSILNRIVVSGVEFYNLNTNISTNSNIGVPKNYYIKSLLGKFQIPIYYTIKDTDYEYFFNHRGNIYTFLPLIYSDGKFKEYALTLTKYLPNFSISKISDEDDEVTDIIERK